LARPHLRYRKQPAGAQLMHCVLLDTSASMLRGQQLARAKGYLQAIAAQAYRQRDKLCVLGFSGDSAYVIQAGAKAQALNDSWIGPIAGGGGSPLASAIALLERLLQHARRQGPVHACVWLLTDGRFAQMPERPHGAGQITVIGFDQGGLPLQLSQRLAARWQADWVPA
jgi:magnesium chelatase subunit ChlD-like protein